MSLLLIFSSFHDSPDSPKLRLAMEATCNICSFWNVSNLYCTIFYLYVIEYLSKPQIRWWKHSDFPHSHPVQTRWRRCVLGHRTSQWSDGGIIGERPQDSPRREGGRRCFLQGAIGWCVLYANLSGFNDFLRLSLRKWFNLTSIFFRLKPN